jgi:uracil-DNA glycosylase family 4
MRDELVVAMHQTPPDRTLLLASLRDYLEQLREEGLEGLPVTEQCKPNRPAPALETLPEMPTRITSSSYEPLFTVRCDDSTSRRSQSEPAPTLAASFAPSTASNELFYRYPGLEKTADLKALRDFIGSCTRCKLATVRTNIVFGAGNPKADLMFVGEAPGADEDLQGEPFVGRAGQLLTDIIERGIGISRGDVYICNVVKCRPPDNRNPEPDEVSACEPFLFRQIDLVHPKVIVGLGTFAVHALLKVKTPISKLRGKWQEVRGIKMMPTFHPAYLLRNPADKRLVWADIQEVMRFLGQPVPSRPTRR